MVLHGGALLLLVPLLLAVLRREKEGFCGDVYSSRDHDSPPLLLLDMQFVQVTNPALNPPNEI